MRKTSLAIAVCAALLALSLDDGRAGAQSTPREGTFTARWVVTGTWRGMTLGEDREIILAELGGRLDPALSGVLPLGFRS